MKLINKFLRNTFSKTVKFKFRNKDESLIEVEA